MSMNSVTFNNLDQQQQLRASHHMLHVVTSYLPEVKGVDSVHWAMMVHNTRVQLQETISFTPGRFNGCCSS
jgi:hypothetical protein